MTGRYLGCSAVEVKGAGTQIRRFWVDTTTNAEWPNTPEFQLIKDKCLLVEHLTAGQEIEVSFNLRGRKATGADGVARVYNSLDAWRVNVVQRTSAAFMATGGQITAATATMAAQNLGQIAAATAPTFAQSAPELEDNLPF